VAARSEAYGVWRPGPQNVLVEGLLRELAQGLAAQAGSTRAAQAADVSR
jgi:hypothetical protein